MSDPAVVQAIFPGDPYVVVTDKRPIGTARSKWENPFMAGRPSPAADALAEGKLDEAFDHYKDAWKKAGGAVK